MAIRAGFVVFVLNSDRLFKINPRVSAIVQNADHAISQFNRYAFRFLALRGTRGFWIVWIVRAASAMCASVFFATHAASVAGIIERWPPVAVFLQCLRKLRNAKHKHFRQSAFLFPPAMRNGVFVNLFCKAIETKRRGFIFFAL